MKRAFLFDIAVDLIDRNQLVSQIVERAGDSRKSTIAHVNTKALNLAYQDRRFKQFLQGCDLVYFDGFGALMGARCLGYPAKRQHRNTCPDFLDQLLEQLTQKGHKIFFLGAKAEVIERLDEVLAVKHPRLNYKAHHGFFEKKGKPNEEVINQINSYQPHVLYVGFGMPLQEYWLMENRDKINAKVFLPEGACLDFYTDTVYRGPQWLTDHGLEWLSRLVTEPGRLWKRYLLGNPQFLYRIAKERFRGRH